MASARVGDRGRCVAFESPMGSAHVHPGPYYPILLSHYMLYVQNATPSNLYHQAREMVEEHIAEFARCEETHGGNCFEQTLAPATIATTGSIFAMTWNAIATMQLAEAEGQTQQHPV